MSVVWVPPIGGILFIQQRIVPSQLTQGWQKLRYRSSVFLEPHTSIPNDTFLAESTYLLEPGEWYPIKGITYNDNYPTISIPLLKSKPGRQWVRQRLDSIGEDITKDLTEQYTGTSGNILVKTHTNDRNIYVNGKDLNGKACILTTKEEAIQRRKDFKSGTPLRHKTQRFHHILSE